MPENLSKDDRDLLVNLIRQFRIAVSNMRLYATNSEAVQNSIRTLFDSLTTFLSKHKYMTLGFVEEKPIVNKVDISKGLTQKVKPGVFLERLNAHNIKTITFRFGITFEELVAFLESLKEKYDSSHPLNEKLKERGIEHIGVNEKIYTAIGDKDLVIERGEEILSKSKGAIEQILDQVEKIVDMTLTVEDPSQRERLKLEIGKKLLFKDPQLIEKLLVNEGGRTQVTDLFPEEKLTVEEIENILGEIIGAYRLSKKGKHKEVLERLEQLMKDTVEMLKKFDPAYTISESLFADIDIMDDFSKKWDKMAIKDVTSEEERIAKKILTESPFNLLSEPMLKEVVEKLASRGLWKPASKIVAKLLLTMDSPNPGTRAKALGRFNEIRNVVFMNASAKEFYAVYMKLLSVFFKETAKNVLDNFLLVLPPMTQKAYERGLKNEVLKLFSFINMELSSSKSSKERKDMFLKFKQAFARNMKDVLIEKIMAGEDVDPFTLKAVYSLSEVIVSDIVDVLKNVDEERYVNRISRILESMGSVTESAVLSEIGVEQDAVKLKRLLELVDEFQNRHEVINTLEVALKSSPSNLKPIIFKKLVDLGATSMENFAIEFVDSEEPEVQLLGFEYLLKNTPDKVRDRVEHLLIPKKVLFLKFQQQAYIKVKKRVIELIGEERLLWGVPYVIPQLAHQDRNIKKAAYEALLNFKPEILRNYGKDFKQIAKSKDPLARDYLRKIEEYMGR